MNLYLIPAGTPITFQQDRRATLDVIQRPGWEHLATFHRNAMFARLTASALVTATGRTILFDPGVRSGEMFGVLFHPGGKHRTDPVEYLVKLYEAELRPESLKVPVGPFEVSFPAQEKSR